MPSMLWSDFRRSARTLRSGLSLIVIVTLALGIGAGTAVFSVLNGVLLEPLPYPDSDRLVNIYRFDPPVAYGPVSTQGFADLRDELNELMTVAGYDSGYYTVGREQGAARALGARVTDGFFAVLGLPPLRGRWLDAADESGDTNGVVISSGFWRQQFGGRDDVVGTQLLLNGEPWTIVGIAPPSLDLPPDRDVWLPLRFARQPLQRDTSFMLVSGRMRDGANLVEIQERMNALAARYAVESPGLSLQAVGLQDRLVAGLRGQLWMLLTAVSLVMLIVCANVANLVLSRMLARDRELATRAALGASPAKLARETAAEVLLTVGLGAAGGIALAAVAIELLIALQPPNLPRLDALTLDLRVLGFAVGAALVTGVLCSALPALHALRTDGAAVLHGGRGSAAPKRVLLRRALVVAQLALSMALLVAAGLLFASIEQLSRVDPGFDTSALLSAMLALPAPLPDGGETEDYVAQIGRNSAFLSELERRLSTLPGVAGVGFIDSMPLSGTNNWNGRITAPGLAFEPGRAPTVEFRWVTPSYFAAIGIPILAGEGFSPTTASAESDSVLVNRALAELLWPGQDAVGKQIGDALIPGRLVTVRGVVGNARQWSLDRAASPELYFTYAGMPAPSTTTVMLRTSVEPSALAEPLRRTVADLDRDVPVFDVRSMAQVTASANARRAFALTLLVAFAGIAALVAATGVYGVTAYAVARRTRDIGVRMALGAERGRVLRAVLRDAMALAVAGVVIGAAAALLFARLLQGLLWGVERTEPAVYLVTAALLALVTFAASLLPAVRASRVAPMEALRSD